jgi:hypothetical protein
MHLDLHLTDDTQLHAHGFLADGTLFAEVHWTHPLPDRPLGRGILWGSPVMLRQLAALATQAAIQAEEEACWHAHQATRAAPQPGRVA